MEYSFEGKYRRTTLCNAPANSKPFVWNASHWKSWTLVLLQLTFFFEQSEWVVIFQPLFRFNEALLCRNMYMDLYNSSALIFNKYPIKQHTQSNNGEWRQKEFTAANSNGQRQLQQKNTNEKYRVAHILIWWRFNKYFSKHRHTHTRYTQVIILYIEKQIPEREIDFFSKKINEKIKKVTNIYMSRAKKEKIQKKL